MVAAVTATVCAAVSTGGCWTGSRDLESWESETKEANWRWFIDERELAAPDGILRVDIGVNGYLINFFRVDRLEATDQDGRACPFAGASVQIIKGGTHVIIRVKADQARADKVIIRARIMLNDKTADVVVGLRRRTIEERWVNPDWEWTHMEEPRSLTVSERP
jgi:hypothetical protein